VTRRVNLVGRRCFLVRRLDRSVCVRAQLYVEEQRPEFRQRERGQGLGEEIVASYTKATIFSSDQSPAKSSSTKAGQIPDQ
jgi:hypothetical protein